MGSQKKGPVECHLDMPVIILVILSRRGEKPFKGKPFGLKQGQVEWVLKKRDQLNALLICLSSSSSSCLVGRRNLFRENLLGDLGPGSRKAQLPTPSLTHFQLPNAKVTTRAQL